MQILSFVFESHDLVMSELNVIIANNLRSFIMRCEVYRVSVEIIHTTCNIVETFKKKKKLYSSYKQ